MLYDSFSHRWKSSKVMAPLVVFLFLRAGLFAPSVEILVGYAPGLRKVAPAVLAAPPGKVVPHGGGYSQRHGRRLRMVRGGAG